MGRVRNWIYLENLKPLIAEIEFMAGERLDDGVLRLLLDDIQASDTDASPERWACCVFDGPSAINASLGIDQGTDVLLVDLSLPDTLVPSAKATLHLMRTYALRGLYS